MPKSNFWVKSIQSAKIPKSDRQNEQFNFLDHPKASEKWRLGQIKAQKDRLEVKKGVLLCQYRVLKGFRWQNRFEKGPKSKVRKPQNQVKNASIRPLPTMHEKTPPFESHIKLIKMLI
jgi:hypothetical protein